MDVRVSVPIETDDGTEFLGLRALPGPAYDALLSAHPDPAGVMPFEEDTFGPALIHACLADDIVDPDVVQGWWETWPPDLVEEVFATALELSAPGSVEWAIARLRSDGRFAAEMAYCGPAGIPHGIFLGWARADQDKAIAWQTSKDDHCPGCGVPSRMMDDPGAAQVVQRRCAHCEAISAAEDEVPTEQKRAIHTHVVPTLAVGDEA